MSGLIQISDPHFGTERQAAVDALVRLVQQRRPRLVVLSGDITQRATAAQFAAAGAFVERLAPVPVLAIPGNHDITLYDVFTRVLRPYARYAAVFGEAADRTFSDGTWHVVALNTTRPWRHSRGEVSARQVAFVADSLRRAPPGAVKVVVTHQPVAVIESIDESNLLVGREPALQGWHDAGADLVLGGHIHLPFLVPLHVAHGSARPMWAVQSGTAVSTRVRAGTANSVTELLADPGQNAGAPRCSVRFWDWQIGAPAFEPRATITLGLAAQEAAVAAHA